MTEEESPDFTSRAGLVNGVRRVEILRCAQNDKTCPRERVAGRVPRFYIGGWFLDPRLRGGDMDYFLMEIISSKSALWSERISFRRVVI